MRRTAVPEEFRSAEEGISPAQLKFVLSLLDERDLRQSDKVVAATDEEYAAAISGMKERAAELTKREASAWIDRLLTFPHRPRERNVQRGSGGGMIPSADDMPTGHYAIENEDGELRFYRFWRGTRNPNYVKLYVEHGPDDSEVPFRSALTIIGKIMKAGPFDCARRYGAEIKACSVCGTRLTNRVSRLLKIGPICGGRYWADESEWKQRVSVARDTLLAAGLDPAGSVLDEDEFDYSQNVD
jgi:hypothetical protein